MVVKEILENIFLLLDPKLQNASYFKELEGIILSNCNGNINNFNVSSEIYDCLSEFDLVADLGITTESEVELSIGSMSFNICEINGQLMVDLKIRKQNALVSTLFTINDSISRVEYINIPMEDGEYKDFMCEVYHYKNNKMLPIQVNGEKDMVFSKEFGIPLRLAHYFRINFKKIFPILPSFLDNNEFEDFEPYLEEEDFYLFLRPFRLLDIKQFVNEQVIYEFKGELESIVREHGELAPICDFELDTILEQLILNVGLDGEIVMSHNIYQSLALYLMGFLDYINTKGIIVKKVNDFYTLFYVAIDNEQVIVIPKQLNDGEVVDVYRKNPLNQDIEELKDFFGIGRVRG